jgi:hypothetical protein
MVTGAQHGPEPFEPVLVYQGKIVFAGKGRDGLLRIIQVIPLRVDVGIRDPVFSVPDALLVPPEEIQSIGISIPCIVDIGIFLVRAPAISSPGSCSSYK